MNQISRADLDRLASIAGMLGSDHSGEVLNAANQARSWLTAHRTSWREVLVPDDPKVLGQHGARPIPWSRSSEMFPDNWAEVVQMCVRAADCSAVTDRDRQFLRALSGYSAKPSPKQIAWLRSIVERLAAQQGGSS